MPGNDGISISAAELRQLKKAFASGDQPSMLAALGDVARRGSILELSRSTGIARKALYDALSEAGNPRFSTLIAVLPALGLQLDVVSASPKEPARD